MAQHSTTAPLTGLRPYRTNYGSFPARGYPESTGQSFTEGQLVQLNMDASTDTHRVEAASSNSTAYLGVAASAASSVQDNMVTVWEARPGNHFLGWVQETILSSMVGEYRQFSRRTGDSVDVLTAATTNARARIVEVGLQDVAGGPYNIGDTNGYVAFEFVADWTAFGPKTPPAQ